MLFLSLNLLKLIYKCYYIIKCIDLDINDSIYYIIQIIVNNRLL